MKKLYFCLNLTRSEAKSAVGNERTKNKSSTLAYIQVWAKNSPLGLTYQQGTNISQQNGTPLKKGLPITE
jgi:hypothetical protein